MKEVILPQLPGCSLTEVSFTFDTIDLGGEMHSDALVRVRGDIVDHAIPMYLNHFRGRSLSDVREYLKKRLTRQEVKPIKTELKQEFRKPWGDGCPYDYIR